MELEEICRHLNIEKFNKQQRYHIDMAGQVDYNWYRQNSDSWFFNLDDGVLKALDFFIKNGIPKLDLGNYKRTLGLGSGNAFETVRILLSDRDSSFANESTYESELKKGGNFDGAVLLSASGSKDAPGIAKYLKTRNIEVRLLTCNSNAPAKEFIDSDKVFVFKKIPEPYTYNTVTYLGMILAKTKENPKKILKYIKEVIDPLLERDFSRYTGYYFLVPKEFDVSREMFKVKFQELFGRKISRDFFTPDFAEKHATDIVESPSELFLSFGYDNQKFGKDRLKIPLPENAGYGSMIAIGYYVIGKIQRANPPFFKERIVDWSKKRGIEPLVK